MNELAGSKQFNRAKGTAGESVACRFLENSGYIILNRNYQNRVGEIDIIAMKNDVVHFIEVKLRYGDGFGTGREAVHPGKQKTIRNVAQAYLIENGLWEEVCCCFDVIEISGRLDGDYDIDHIENCFE